MELALRKTSLFFSSSERCAVTQLYTEGLLLTWAHRGHVDVSSSVSAFQHPWTWCSWGLRAPAWAGQQWHCGMGPQQDDRVRAYPGLGGTQKDHQVQLLHEMGIPAFPPVTQNPSVDLGSDGMFCLCLQGQMQYKIMGIIFLIDYVLNLILIQQSGLSTCKVLPHLCSIQNHNGVNSCSASALGHLSPC